ncbi:Gfo/Idh/MocA family protein [Ancylobacter mangrovi]|uniref:Gfo/Idh/MocA family protein n=1 Tax=Ancylobacter mangrovi TaxID=2972472 RepID=UPI0021639936|nr:Gfo/Idh/MocA family oxidoreductase [Ancylobacter mangrovi]MCS0504266.1 Gfo/Idh/MocA family oxidoreductase [Ancylobacter mangrovi]
MLNAAIIGLGSWGRTLVDAVQGKSGLIRFTRAATGNRARAADYAALAGIALEDSYEAVLAAPGVDALVLATPHLQHAGQIVQAAAAGKHVFVEKPFTMTRASAETAVAAAAKAGIALGLGHNRRFHPHVARLREMLRAGEVGTVLHCHAEMTSSSALFLPGGVWRTDPEQSPAGGMTGLGIHLVDLMIDLLGEIDAVACQSLNRAAPSGAQDTTSVSLRLRSGVTATLLAFSATAPVFRFTVYGSQAVVSIEGPTLDQMTIRPAARGPGKPALPPLVETLSGFDTVRAELEAFAHAAGGGAPYPISAAQMVHGVAVLEAIIAAAGQDRFVTVT